MDKKQRGGKRTGAGMTADKYYTAPRKKITLNIPEIEHPAAKEFEKKILDKYRVKRDN